MRSLLNLAIVLLVLHGIVRFVPAYYQHQQLRDAVVEAALGWHGRTEYEMQQAVLAIAEERGLPIDADGVTVSATGQQIVVDVHYAVPIEFLPRWPAPWTFEDRIEAVALARPLRRP